MLKKQPKTEEIWEEAEGASDTLELSSEDEYILIKSKKMLREAEEENSYPGIPDKEDVTSKIEDRLGTPYPHDAASDKELLEAVTKFVEIVGQPSGMQQDKVDRITDLLSEKIGDNITQEHVIPKLERQDVNLPETVSDLVKHLWMSWTYCYNDDCRVYWSSKDTAGWYPRRPRGYIPRSRMCTCEQLPHTTKCKEKEFDQLLG